MMDNSKKSIDVRYFIKDDPYHFFEGLDVNEFIFSHGMSGYWACGFINAAKDAYVILEDTWQRPIIVLDETTTKGIIFLTASGPLADIKYDSSVNTNLKKSGLVELYKHFINYLITKKLQHA